VIISWLGSGSYPVSPQTSHVREDGSGQEIHFASLRPGSGVLHLSSSLVIISERTARPRGKRGGGRHQASSAWGASLVPGTQTEVQYVCRMNS
jgi:hypothetical protein